MVSSPGRNCLVCQEGNIQFDFRSVAFCALWPSAKVADGRLGGLGHTSLGRGVGIFSLDSGSGKLSFGRGDCVRDIGLGDCIFAGQV